MEGNLCTIFLMLNFKFIK